jgi:hypothetical protein
VAITFDPATKRIILDSAYVNVKDMYSRWKEWVQLSDNAKYLPAFRAIGGDSLGGALYVSLYTFLLNGWRVRPMESNHTLVIEGNISVDGGGDPVVHTIGTYNVLVQYTVPERAQAIATSGGGGATAGEIASAIRAELAAELDKINQLTFTTPNRVDASSIGGSSAPGVLYWNGTAWTPAGT